MRLESNIAKTVEEVNGKAKYDAEVKKVLSDPQILAWILKYTVYSIWICMDVPMNSEYTITGYRMNREDIFGHMDSNANQRFDLMELVMVCLGKPENVKRGTELHKLLTMVLSDTLTPEEKKKALHEEYNIITGVELEGGLAKMCNLSEYIEQKGIQKGIQKGYLQAVCSLVKQNCITVEKASQEVGLAAEEFKEIYQKYLEGSGE